MEMIVVGILALLAIGFWKAGIGALFSPWMITCLIWMAVLTGVAFSGDNLYPVKNQFYNAFFLWLPVFLISAIATYCIIPPKQRNCGLRASSSPALPSLDVRNGLYMFLLVVAMIISPLQMYEVVKIVSMFDSESMLSNIRLLAVEGSESYGFLEYAHVINQVLFVIALWKYPKVPWWHILIIVLCNLLSCLAIMEKSGIFFMVIVSMFVLYERKVVKIRTITITMCLIVGVLFIFNVLLLESRDKEAEYELFDFIGAYILTPPVAFGYLEPEMEGQFGQHTFPVAYLFMNRLGLGHFIVQPRVCDFVWVPVCTNVYTVFQPFYEDFGYLGIPFFALIYGVMSGYFYRLYRNGDGTACCIYTMLMEILVLQYYMEGIFTNLVQCIQFVFLVFILTYQGVGISLYDYNSLPKASDNENKTL